MSAPKRGLGKGLDALLSTCSQANKRKIVDRPNAYNESQSLVDSQLRELPIDQLSPGKYQPRKKMSEQALEELARSIKSQGVIQPIVVRPIEANRYEIIAGERRWRASKQAQLFKVPCIIRQVADNSVIAMALIENIQREDLNVIEEAFALERLQNEFQLTHLQISEAVGKSRTAVSNLLRLNHLSNEVKDLVSDKQLDMGHARALLSLDGEAQVEVAQLVVQKNLTVRETEKLVKKVLEPRKKIDKMSPIVMDNEIENRLLVLQKKLETDVKLVQGQKEKGKIVINYKNIQELQVLLNKLS